MSAIFQRIASYTERMERPLLTLIIFGLVIRLILAPLLTFNIDAGYWTQVIDVFKNGFGLYGTDGYYYTPIWGYILGADSLITDALGMTDFGRYVEEFMPFINSDFKVNAFVTSVGFNTIVKVPLILADLAVGALLYEMVMKFTKNKTKAIFAFVLWFFCPLVITQSAVHGMFDTVSVLFILISIMMTYERHYFIAGMAFSAAVLTKFFPIFFIFFLIALVIKQEGTGENGIKSLMKSIGGGIVCAALVYLPNIINGDLWSSLYFIAYRMGITREMLSSISPLFSLLMLLALVFLIALALYAIYKFLPRLIEAQNRKATDRKVMEFVVGLAVFFILVYVVYIIINPPSTADSIGGDGVALISIFSVFLELYLAYRLIVSKDFNDNKLVTFMFLSGMAIILWPCAPSYILIAFPFIILYAVVRNDGYVKPFVILALLFTLQEITAYMLSFTSLVIQTGGDTSFIVNIMQFLSSETILSLTGAALITTIINIFSYITLLYISFKWYYAYYKGDRNG